MCYYCIIINYSPMLLFLTLQRHPDTPIIHIRHMNDWWRRGFAEGVGWIRFCLVLGGRVIFERLGRVIVPWPIEARDINLATVRMVDTMQSTRGGSNQCRQQATTTIMLQLLHSTHSISPQLHLSHLSIASFIHNHSVDSVYPSTSHSIRLKVGGISLVY